MQPPLPFSTRFVLAWALFFRVLFDGVFARRVKLLGEADESITELPEGMAEKKEAVVQPPAKQTEPVGLAPPVDEAAIRSDGALLLLSLLQQSGRLVDFLRQDIATFEDADVGAAARVVHEGCRKTLEDHVTITALRDEAEGAKIKVEAAETSGRVKLTGNVSGSAPYDGTLRHKGWRAANVKLPTPTKGHDSTIIYPAEVEL
jgi:hypothetical protein